MENIREIIRRATAGSCRHPSATTWQVTGVSRVSGTHTVEILCQWAPPEMSYMAFVDATGIRLIRDVRLALPSWSWQRLRTALGRPVESATVGEAQVLPQVTASGLDLPRDARMQADTVLRQLPSACQP